MRTDHFGTAIIGAGIVGLATGYTLCMTEPGRNVLVLEKETGIAAHQTGHNSGVLHSGIYYKPGSSKAINCREGKAAMESFCEDEEIPYELCGKVIVATHEDELEALTMIYERGQANGVRCRRIGREELAELEPHSAGIEAIHVPEAGIVDYSRVSERLAERIVERGGRIVTSANVTDIRRKGSTIHLETQAGDFNAHYLVNCAGLYSDKIAEMAGAEPSVRIIPFRGEYYELTSDAEHLCRNLIYPVPDPSFPFLGVHLTRMIRGGVECGPNAVLAFAREGYSFSTVKIGELMETLRYPGFMRLASRHWRAASGEMWRSISKKAFVRALRRLVPEVSPEQLKPAHAGVRAQAVARDGSLVDDFLLVEMDRMVHVLNAPSPAATASLNIGKLIAERVAAQHA